MAELRRRLPRGISDEELLLRFGMPAGEVDAMLAVAVGTGLGDSASYQGLALSRRPHLWLRGVDELLEMLMTGGDRGQ